MRLRLRRAWVWFRVSRGYCIACSNHRNQDDTFCDLHLELHRFRGDKQAQEIKPYVD